MTNRFHKYGVLAFICLIASCSRTPKNILSDKAFRSVLYDMLVAEALVETNYDDYRTSDERERVYQGVFAKHQISQAKYDSSMIWYGKNMDLYLRIYKLVIDDINVSITRLGDIKPNPLSGEMSNRDSIDVWINSPQFTFTPKQVFRAMTFDIAPERPYSAGSSYVMGLSVWGMPPEQNNKIRLGLRAVQADTIIFVNQDITGDGFYETILKTVATKSVTRLYGYIQLMDTTDSEYHKVYINDIQLMKYNYGSKALTAPQTDSIP